MIAGAAALVAAAVAFALASPTSATRRSFPRPTHEARPNMDGQRWVIPQFRRTPRLVQPAALAAWSDDLSRALRHGSTLRAALVDTLPSDAVVAHRSAPLRHWLDRGASVNEACDEWADDLAGVSVRSKTHNDRTELLVAMAAVLGATARLGGPAAAPLDRFAVTMRQRASDDLERAAHSAQAMMSARVLTSVPIAVLGLLVATDADVRSVIASTTGAVVVTLGLALNAVGAVWMRRIARGNVLVGSC